MVALHWGLEYYHPPTEDQLAIADALTQSNDIDFIYGHHAHVVQPYGKVNGTWVVYGLGNAVAQQDTAVEGVYDGNTARVTFQEKQDGSFRVAKLEYIPTMITHFDGVNPMRWLNVPQDVDDPEWAGLRDALQATGDRVTEVIGSLGAFNRGVIEGRVSRGRARVFSGLRSQTGRFRTEESLWPCGCRRCSCAPCARTRRTLRCRATGCSSAPATCAALRRASTPGCRSGTRCCATSSGSCARRWTPSAPKRCTSRRCCPASPTRRAVAGPSTATTSSGSRTARARDYLLGPTHEEMFTLLVKDLYSSYKDLPLSIYQIQTKYRDEQRPRAGILRGREFVMKDSYSFDIDDDAFLRSYEAHREAYVRIFDRLGLDYVIVAAMSGAMGGSASEEFLARAEVGEDTYVRCTNCDYAANVEAVRVPVPADIPYDDAPAAHAEQTPDTPTIETLVDHLNEKFPRDDRPWTAGRHAQERDRAARAPRRPARAAGDRRARRPRRRPEAARRPGRTGRGARVRRGGVRQEPRAGEGLHRSRGARRDRHGQDPLPARPAHRARHALGDRSERRRQPRDRPGGRARLRGRRRDRGRRHPRRRRLPQLRPRARVGARHRDGPHLPARHASTPTRSISRCSTRTASWSP